MFPDSDSPNKYYVCLIRKDSRTIQASKKECPVNTAFSLETLRCMSNEEFRLLHQLKKPKEKLSPRTERFVCPSSGTFQNIQNCRAYYICSMNGEIGEKKLCPKGTFFDETKLQCSSSLSEYCVNQFTIIHKQQVADANALYKEIKLKSSKSVPQSRFRTWSAEGTIYFPSKMPFNKRLSLRSRYFEYQTYNIGSLRPGVDSYESVQPNPVQLPSVPVTNTFPNFISPSFWNTSEENTATTIRPLLLAIPTSTLSTTNNSVSTEKSFSTLLPITTTTPLLTTTSKPPLTISEPLPPTDVSLSLYSTYPLIPTTTPQPATTSPQPTTTILLNTTSPESTTKISETPLPTSEPLTAYTLTETKTLQPMTTTPQATTTIALTTTSPNSITATPEPPQTSTSLPTIATSRSIITSSEPTSTSSKNPGHLRTMSINKFDNQEQNYICHAPGLFVDPFNCHNYYLCFEASFKPYKLKAKHLSCGNQWFSESFKSCGDFKPFGCQ